MRHIMFALGICSLGGCAMTIPDLRSQGTERLFRSELAPPDFARCAVQRTPEEGLHALAQMREPGTAFTVTYGPQQLAAIVEATPAGTGSAVTARLLPYLVGFEQNRVLGGVLACAHEVK